MGRACRLHRVIRNVQLKTRREKKNFRRPTDRCGMILKWILEMFGGCGIPLSGSGQEPVCGCCEHCNEISGSMSGEEFPH
jgi:hypothetical protein